MQPDTNDRRSESTTERGLPTESLGQILSRLGLPKPGTPEAEAWVRAGPEPADTKPAICPVCRGTGIGMVPVERDGVRYYREDACTCDAGDPYRGRGPTERHRLFAALQRLRRLFALKPWCGAGIREATLEDFPAQRSDIVHALAEGRGLYVHGPTGTGKTHLAAAILREQARRGRMVDGLNVPRWFAVLRSAIADGREAEQTADEIVEATSQVEVLAIDDVGSEKVSEWNGERLYHLTDGRWLDRDSRLTIVTTNLTLDELEDEFARPLGRRQAQRLCSRLNGMCPVDIELAGEDRRANGQ